MRKRKKILKNLSSEIFNDKKEDTNYDIFADKDNLIIEDNSTTPKLEEDNSIELGEINNILQNKIEDKNNEDSNNELKVTPIFPESELKEDNSKTENEDSNNNAPVEPVFPELNNELTSITDIEQSNKDNIDNDETTNEHALAEPIFPEINEENTIETEQPSNNIDSDNDEVELSNNDPQEDKTSLNELISSDDSSLNEIEKDILSEEDDDTTFNELNERINEDINLDNTSEDTKEENIDDNINDNEEPEIVGNFPKIDKFGSVVPNK